MQKAQYPAIMLNVTSLRKGRSMILKGVVRHTAPATAVDTKIPAPKSSPKTSSEEEDGWMDGSVRVRDALEEIRFGNWELETNSPR